MLCLVTFVFYLLHRDRYFMWERPILPEGEGSIGRSYWEREREFLFRRFDWRDGP